MSHKCPQCPKRFKTKSGRRRHINAQHPPDETAPQQETVTDVQDAPDLMAERDVTTPDDEKVLRAALKALGIKRKNVVDFKVYPHKVAIIEAPKNWKKTWYRED